MPIGIFLLTVFWVISACIMAYELWVIADIKKNLRQAQKDLDIAQNELRISREALTTK